MMGLGRGLLPTVSSLAPASFQPSSSLLTVSLQPRTPLFSSSLDSLRPTTTILHDTPCLLQSVSSLRRTSSRYPVSGPGPRPGNPAVSSLTSWSSPRHARWSLQQSASRQPSLNFGPPRSLAWRGGARRGPLPSSSFLCSTAPPRLHRGSARHCLCQGAAPRSGAARSGVEARTAWHGGLRAGLSGCGQSLCWRRAGTAAVVTCVRVCVSVCVCERSPTWSPSPSSLCHPSRTQLD